MLAKSCRSVAYGQADLAYNLQSDVKDIKTCQVFGDPSNVIKMILLSNIQLLPSNRYRNIFGQETYVKETAGLQPQRLTVEVRLANDVGPKIFELNQEI